MKPFPLPPLDDIEELFNFKLSSMRMQVECLFGILKSGFACLLRGLLFRSVEKSAIVVCSCVLLHNFLINDKIEIEENVIEELANTRILLTNTRVNTM